MVCAAVAVRNPSLTKTIKRRDLVDEVQLHKVLLSLDKETVNPCGQ
jgi:hypothetical protein